jgi:hypothetical protein
MGDRANAVILTDFPSDRRNGEAVFLYSHWGGTELPETVREALASDAGRKRAYDPVYLARIVFDAMNPEPGGETGLGISTTLTDFEYPLIVLYNGHVWEVPVAVYQGQGFEPLTNGGAGLSRISFEKYIEQPRTWENLTT